MITTNEGSETGWTLGQQCRDKGSIHKDIWEGSALDLALCHPIAIHPISDWWKTRKKLKRYDNSVRYSLVVSIETSRFGGGYLQSRVPADREFCTN